MVIYIFNWFLLIRRWRFLESCKSLPFFIGKLYLCIRMATKRVLPDKDFDRIIVRTHKLARNVTMRVKPDGLHVTVPPYSLSSKVLEVVEQYRQRLLEDWRKVSKKPIDLNFRIHTPCFRLWLEQGNFTCFSVRFTEEGVKIICPRNDGNTYWKEKPGRNGSGWPKAVVSDTNGLNYWKILRCFRLFVCGL